MKIKDCLLNEFKVNASLRVSVATVVGRLIGCREFSNITGDSTFAI